LCTVNAFYSLHVNNNLKQKRNKQMTGLKEEETKLIKLEEPSNIARLEQN
jgi:hypothetical protein